jgi:hypothetical protein
MPLSGGIQAIRLDIETSDVETRWDDRRAMVPWAGWRKQAGLFPSPRSLG